MQEPFSLRVSHVGLFVMDMRTMVDFYNRVLGLTVTDQGKLGEADLTFLSRDPQEHHQIVLVSGRPPGLPNRIVNQISLRMGSLEELRSFYQRIRQEGVSDLAPVTHGFAWSVYFRDPEGNRIEVFVDTDWYVTQPVREPLDLDQPEVEIRRSTEVFCRTRAGFKPIAEWRAEVARKIAANQAKAVPKA